jgi:hypothetical protein
MYGVLAWRSGSLWMSAGVHLGNNSFITMFVGNASEKIPNSPRWSCARVVMRKKRLTRRSHVPLGRLALTLGERRDRLLPEQAVDPVWRDGFTRQDHHQPHAVAVVRVAGEVDARL